MHELAIVEGLVKQAQKKAEEHRALKVNVLRIVVGTVTGYVEESIRFYFDKFSVNTLLEGARLEVRYVNPELFCDACQKSFERRRFSFDCPTCGKTARMAGRGTEFYIESMDIEEENA